MKTFKARIDILPPGQLRLLPALEPVRRLGFVLYGGTAIALRLGHRCSIDFDFFATDPLNKEILRSNLEFLASSEVLQDEPNALSVLTPESVKVSFFGALGFGRYGNPDLTENGVLAVASLDDLMALKVKVILQRVESKDYIDVAAMLGAGVSLEKGLAVAAKMFAPHFSVMAALKALAYFEGGDLAELSAETKDLLVQAVDRVSQLPEISQLSPALNAG